MYPYEASVKVTVDACHQLDLPYTSKCNSQHGHTYRIELLIGALQLDENAMVCDFVTIKDAVKEKYDHANLNTHLEKSTAETFANALYDEVKLLVKGLNCWATLLSVSVSETESTRVTYREALA